MAIVFPVILYVIYLAVFVQVILRANFFAIENTNKKHFVFFFLLKVVAGILLTLVYTYYYTDQQKADIYRYFNDSKIISPLLFTDPVAWLKIMSGCGINQPQVFKYLLPTQYFSHPGSDIVTNNTFIIRINVLLNYFSFYNIYINTLLLNFISFAAITALFKVLRVYFSAFQQILYVPLYLLPSVLFWSSGLLKEELLFTGISLYLYSYLNPQLTRWQSLLLTVAGILILAYTKLQVAALAILFVVAFLSFKKNEALRLRLPVLLVVLATAFILYGNSICRVLLEKRNEFTELAINENAGSYFDSKIIEPTLSNLVVLLPEALVNAILRPFVWDGGKVFQKVFAVENFFFLLLIILPLRYFKLPRGEKLLLCLCFLFFALFNYLVIGITIPVMGAIVHYRVIAEPFLLLAVLLSVDLERLNGAVKKINSTF